MKKVPNQNGFIALISILIVSAVLLATTLGLAQFGLANRFFILSLEQKASSKNLAEACVHIARVQAYNDPLRDDVPADPVAVAGGECRIVSMTPNGNTTTIETSAVVGEATTNLRVEVNNTNGSFITFTEVASL